MKGFLVFIKRFLQGVIIALVALYVLLYVLFSIPTVQTQLCRTGERQLEALLGVSAEVARIEFFPFNRLELFGVMLPDLQGDTLLYANKIAAGVDLWKLTGGQICLTNIQLFGVDVRITRGTPDSRTNLQFVIDAFSSDGEKDKKSIDLCINSALVRRSRISYDVLSEPHKPAGMFDANHIVVSDLLTTLSLKALDEDSLNVYVKRLSFEERSGLSVDRLTMRVEANHDKVVLSNFMLQLPHSLIGTDTVTFDLSAAACPEQIGDSARIAFGVDHGRVVLADVASLVPAFRRFYSPIDFSCGIEGTLNDLRVGQILFDLDGGAVRFDSSLVLQNLLCPDSLGIHCEPIRLTAGDGGALLVADNLSVTDENVRRVLGQVGGIEFKGDISGTFPTFVARGMLVSGVGDLQADVVLSSNAERTEFYCHGYVGSDGVELSELLGERSCLGMTAFDVRLDGRKSENGVWHGLFDGRIGRLDYKGYSYRDISVNAEFSNNSYNGMVCVDDPNGYLCVDGLVRLNGRHTVADVEVVCREVDLSALHLLEKYPDYKLSFLLDAAYTGNRLDNANGYVRVDSLSFGTDESLFAMNRFELKARNDTLPQRITVQSDYMNGYVTGEYRFSTLRNSLYRLAMTLVPSLVPSEQGGYRHKNVVLPDNNLQWHITVEPNIEMSRVLRLPFTLTDRATVTGFLHDMDRTARLRVSLPNIWIGKKHIEDGDIYLNHQDGELSLSAQAGLINKKRVATLWSIRGQAHDDNIDLGVNWNTNTLNTYCGAVNLKSKLSRCDGEDNGLDVAVDVLPTTFIINDTVWDVKPAHISVHDRNFAVEGVEISRPSQHIQINGCVSESPSDTLHVDLREVNLDYVFETLNINYVSFGGRATGRVDVADVFSSSPYLCTRKLDVKDFSYNSAVFGDISLQSMWNTENKGILLKGVISGESGNESYVDGYIFPTLDSLAIAFDVNRLPLPFIRPFVDKILSDADGCASGRLLLAGNFKRISLTGEAFAHDFSFGVPYLNTHYTVTDSVYFTDHSIWFRNVCVTDEKGNTARGDGVLNHRFFSNLRYDISIHDANNLLVFNIPNSPGSVYYGTIYGTGRAAIKGDDLRTDIDVNMVTDNGSKFTFVLTNTTNAVDYQFLTFSNMRAEKSLVSDSVVIETDSSVIRNNRLMEQQVAAPESKNVMFINLQADITPQAEITLVMDEVTGDKMKATGDGNIRLEYNTAEDEIKMYGSYTVGKGSYNFSLQDIITRDFTLNSGSTVMFRGSPLDAVLNINATYSLQANLADLDESFTTDKELTRTIVPVHTILKISGNMMKPDVGFDIELPTLSADIDSKMRSIISTDEMMTRQIIYLLALNRFFTPDYNTGLNGNNEWVAMASSTLSSSLGALLGQISENWNISPNFRSDKGDFSDVEVDLALSSQLLNNRLIFNGNFGYRDKRYNSTNFVGDFDLEYLLTENGNFRLKGYNHFNDRNYSMRTALTTQGIGIMYKRDFDSWMNFFESPWKKKRRSEPAVAVPAVSIPDSTVVLPSDSSVINGPDDETGLRVIVGEE